MDEDALSRIQADPVSAAVWARLQSVMSELHDVVVEPKKTSLHITRGRAFLGVHPRSGGLLLNVVTTDALDSPRIRSTEQVSARRVHNEVLLTGPGEVDDEVREWIRCAYQIAGGTPVAR
jgi:hypothetical protein